MSTPTRGGSPLPTWITAGSGKVWAYVRPLIGVVLLWTVIAWFELIPPQALPSPVAVADALLELTLDGTLAAQLAVTIPRIVLAFSGALIAGVAVGLLMAEFRLVAWFFDPIISILFPIPKITLVPVFVLWFGFDTRAVVALAGFEAFFPIAIATYGGTKAVDRELIWSAKAMGLSRLATGWKVILPAALPDVLNGAQIALFLSFVVVIVAEMVMAGSGLGRLLIESIRFFETPNAIAVIVVISVFGLVFDRLFRLARWRIVWWTD